MKYRKTLLLGIIVTVILISVITVISINRNRALNYSEQLVCSPNGKYILSVQNKGGLMAFSSSNKELVLYNRCYFVLGRCRFGEHQLNIDGWDDENIYISIKTRYKNTDKIKYITSWIKKNKRIGGFNLKYQLISPDITIEY